MQSVAATMPAEVATQVALPRDQRGPVFAAPWEATAFALVVNLAQAGHYTWSEWVAYFSAELAAARDAELRGDATPSYYEHWLVAAEKLIVAKGLASADQLAFRKFFLRTNGTCKPMRQ